MLIHINNYFTGKEVIKKKTSAAPSPPNNSGGAGGGITLVATRQIQHDFSNSASNIAAQRKG